jgi:hypothetical protein
MTDTTKKSVKDHSIEVDDVPSRLNLVKTPPTPPRSAPKSPISRPKPKEDVPPIDFKRILH